MKERVAGRDVSAVDRVRLAIHLSDTSAGFLDDQFPRGPVPGVQIEFPKTIQPACRHIGQIQGSRARAAHSVGAQRDLVIEVNIDILMPLFAGETGGCQCLFQMFDRRDVYFPAVDFAVLDRLRQRRAEWVAAQHAHHDGGISVRELLRRPLDELGEVVEERGLDLILLRDGWFGGGRRPTGPEN